MQTRRFLKLNLSKKTLPLHSVLLRRGCATVSASTAKVSPMDLFKSIDKDNSGSISQAEYDETVEKMNHEDLIAYTKMAFNAIDADKSGTISEEEFRNSIGVLQNEELSLLKKALSRNELSESPKDSTESIEDVGFGTLLMRRLVTTVEVCVSKIIPAGAGWQGGALIAGQMGYTATDTGLFLMAGLGDAVGVGFGHFLYYAAKNALGSKQDLKAQFHTSILLSTACIFSGTAWQPIVNFLHDTAHVGFDGTMIGVVSGCSLMFFTGLRFGRLLWSPMLSGVAGPSYQNLKADGLLSFAVGGATGAFVGTDISFEVPASGAEAGSSAVVDQNWLRPVVGIEESYGELQQMATAGASTGLGFMVTQTGQNLVVPAGKNWVD